MHRMTMDQKIQQCQSNISSAIHMVAMSRGVMLLVPECSYYALHVCNVYLNSSKTSNPMTDMNCLSLSLSQMVCVFQSDREVEREGERWTIECNVSVRH